MVSCNSSSANNSKSGQDDNWEMIFPQDQLGALVRTHIAEQTVRFGAAQETIRVRTKELQDATQQRQQAAAAMPSSQYAYYNQPQPRQQQDGSERAPSTGSIACAAINHVAAGSRSASLQAATAANMSRSRDGSPVAAPVAPYDCYPRGEEGRLHNNYSQQEQQQQQQQSSPWDTTALPPSVVSGGCSTRCAAPHTELARWLEDAIAASPLIAQLQSKSLRLETHLTDALKRIDDAHQRIRAVEDENATLRLELQAVKAMCDAQDESIAGIYRQQQWSSSQTRATPPPPTLLLSPPQAPAASGMTPSSTDAAAARQVAAAEAHERRQQQDTQALLDAALHEDRSAAAAALNGVVGRRATDVAPKETVCDQCFHKALCTPCSGCASEWYCSVSCALVRREKHRIACDMLRSMHHASSGGGAASATSRTATTTTTQE